MTNRQFIWSCIKDWDRDTCYHMYGDYSTQAQFRGRSPERRFCRAFCRAIRRRVGQIRKGNRK